MKRLMVVFLSLVFSMGLSFASVALFVYVITWCFGFAFSWKIAVGVWTILALIKFWFSKNNKGKSA